MRIARTSILAFLLALTLLVACGEDDPTDTPGGSGAGGSLEGVTWVLGDASIEALVGQVPDDARVDLALEDDRAGGSAACNTYSGGYTVDGDALSFEDFAVTQMACAEELMALETAYLGALGSVTTFAVSDGVLTLTGTDTDTELVYDEEQPPEPLPLTGTTWSLESIASGDAVSTTIAGMQATLVLAEDGTASGNATCNTFSASYEVDGETLTFGPLATTQMACTEMGASEQEAAVLTALEATRSFAIDGDVLTLGGDNGAMLLQYRGT
ncbi:MAG: META domain-containing protein [Actinomycetota bacterium]